MTTHRILQLSVLVDNLESISRTCIRMYLSLKRTHNEKDASYYAAKSIRVERILSKAKLKIADDARRNETNKLLEAAAQWRNAANNENNKRMREICERTAIALEIQNKTGTPVCSCCHKPLLFDSNGVRIPECKHSSYRN